MSSQPQVRENYPADIVKAIVELLSKVAEFKEHTARVSNNPEKQAEIYEVDPTGVEAKLWMQA